MWVCVFFVGEVEELQGRLRASRQRASDLERELITLSTSNQQHEKVSVIIIFFFSGKYILCVLLTLLQFIKPMILYKVNSLFNTFQSKSEYTRVSDFTSNSLNPSYLGFRFQLTL